MKGKKSSRGGILFRAIGFLLVGVMLNLIFLNTINTNAWFTDEVSTSMEVSAASTRDIIQEFKLDFDNKGNPKSIILQGSPNLLDRKALIYFEVEGDIKNYILHINPVWIVANEHYLIPIEPNVSMFQHISLLEFPWESVTGSIRIKYLNEFIDESLEITFTKKYLRSILIDNIKRKEPTKEFSINENKEATNEVIGMIEYLASHLEWEDNNNFRALRNTPSIMTNMSTNIIDEDIEASSIVLEEVPYSKYELNEEQSKVIDIISPNLRSYLEDLYSTIELLVQNINDKIIKIFELEKVVVDYQKTVEELNAQLEEKINEIEKLNEDNQGLRDQVSILESEKDALEDEVRELRKHRCPTVELPMEPTAPEETEPTAPEETEPTAPEVGDTEPVETEPTAPVVVDPDPVEAEPTAPVVEDKDPVEAEPTDPVVEDIDTEEAEPIVPEVEATEPVEAERNVLDTVEQLEVQFNDTAINENIRDKLDEYKT